MSWSWLPWRPFSAILVLVSALIVAPQAVAVDEGQLSCGVASEIVSSVAEGGYGLLKAAPRRVAIPDVPVPPGPGQIEAIIPTESRIEAAVRAVLD